MLATSREKLRITGEVAWRVPSLSLPGPNALEHSEAVRLFVQRAAETTQTFTLNADNAEAVAEICQRLDGMPLALELAAARADVLSPTQIAERLGGALTLLKAGRRTGLTRQQSLRATLDWSHDLLSEPEQTLYRRLGVFAGSFGVEAVEGICDGTLDLLARLVDKSLVQVEPSPTGHRYRLLETISQHAWEMLKQADECARLEAAHREWYLELAEAADRDVDPAVAAMWPAERLMAEHDDLRTALASAIRHDPPVALRLAAAMWWFWMARGYFVEGGRRLEEALAAAPDPTPERARALFCAAGIEVRIRHGSYERLLALGNEALDIARAGGDQRAVARALERHGLIMMGSFHVATGERAFVEGLELAREIGDKPTQVAIKHALGVLTACRGGNAAARALFTECLELLDEIQDERAPLFWASHISPVVLPVGPEGAPRFFFEDTFVLLRSVSRTAGTGYVLCNIGETWRADGDCDAARDALERALALFREVERRPGSRRRPQRAWQPRPRHRRIRHGARLLHRGARAAARGTRPARDRDEPVRPGPARPLRGRPETARCWSTRRPRSSPAPTTARAPSCCRSTSRHSSSTPATRRVRTTCSRAWPSRRDTTLCAAVAGPRRCGPRPPSRLANATRREPALRDALNRFREIGEDRGVRHVLALAARLESQMSGC